MKKYVTPEIAIQTIALKDIVTLSITGFKGLYMSQSGDPTFEDDGMNI